MSPNSVRSKIRYIYIPLVSKSIKSLHRIVTFLLHVLIHNIFEFKLKLLKDEKFLKSVFSIDKNFMMPCNQRYNFFNLFIIETA